MVGISVDVKSFVVGFSVQVPSVRFRVTSRKLQVFRFALIEMFSCFLNSSPF